jgi:cobalt-zinc-cadmium efflux system membrane fusion protein
VSANVMTPVRPVVAPLQIEPQTATPNRRKWWSAVLNSLPNLIVFSALGGVMYLGHHTGWKLPKMSELLGTASAKNDDWCAEHVVPESQCIECQQDLLPKPKPFGFCPEHGVAECVIHHPELAQVKKEPQLPKYDTVRAISLKTRPENNSRNTLHTRRVQFTSAEGVAKSGIDVSVVEERPMTEAITANGELMFDPRRIAHLSTRVPGTVAFVFKSVGEDVQSGEMLALIDAAQVGQTKAQLLQAIVQFQLRKTTVERLRTASVGGAIAGKSLIEAEAALQEAEIGFVSARQALTNFGFEVPGELDSANARTLAEDLQFLGLSKSVVATLPVGAKTANLIPIRAPFSGVIVASEVVSGEFVDSAKSLFTVADPTAMWLILNVRQEEAKYVQRGQPVRFQSDDGSPHVEGTVSWISPAIDEQTRTLQVRVAVSNPQGQLRDRTFGTSRIILREEPSAIVVPKEAVQSTPDANFVFVRDKNYFDESAPKVFHVRQVRLGAKDDQFVELLAGVLPGEVIATKGSAVLLAQLLRSNLGAGCGCHEH